MAQLISDRRDVDFVLHEQIGLIKHERYAEFDKKTVDLIVSEARNFHPRFIARGNCSLKGNGWPCAMIPKLEARECRPWSEPLLWNI